MAREDEHLTEAGKWREEARATVSLAWPIILTNVSQSLIQTTDVLLLGWVGAHTLAAAQLGTNLYVAFLIFGLGLVSAASPIIAKKLGQAPQRPRCPPNRPPGPVVGRRHRPAGLGDPVADGVHPACDRRGSLALRRCRPLRPRAAMGNAARTLLHRAALVRRRARNADLVADRRPCGRRLQRPDQLRFDLRQVRIPGARTDRRRNRKHQREPLHVPGHGLRRDPAAALPPLSSVRTVLAARLAAVPRHLAARPSDRGDDRARDHRLQRRGLPDGLDQRRIDRRPCDRAKHCRTHLHGTARTSRRRLPSGSAWPMAAAIRRASVAPAGRHSCSGSRSWRQWRW